ncbi:hypothetical protein BDY19DRAFT_990004 [Irpex rosettiformis]|uniref:Uncharacterized protein n=1 Tax=Irpex rosettiformis TaxID=378272 RepID=A0ACB8UGG6_9APHY|nr:hypothetical protein BDY19DRAFT_990004 [Irpex rosettiformis]
MVKKAKKLVAEYEANCKLIKMLCYLSMFVYSLKSQPGDQESFNGKIDIGGPKKILATVKDTTNSIDGYTGPPLLRILRRSYPVLFGANIVQ